MSREKGGKTFDGEEAPTFRVLASKIQFLENVTVFWFSDGPRWSLICVHRWDGNVTTCTCKTRGAGPLGGHLQGGKRSPEPCSLSSAAPRVRKEGCRAQDEPDLFSLPHKPVEVLG